MDGEVRTGYCIGDGMQGDGMQGDGMQGDGIKDGNRSEVRMDIRPDLRKESIATFEPAAIPLQVSPQAALARDELIELIYEAEEKAYASQCRANLYRFLSIILSITFILLTAISSVTILVSSKMKYVVAVMCAVAAVIKTLYEAFKIGDRGIFFKYASIQLKNIVWSAKEAMLYLNDWAETYRFINHIRREIDRLDLTVFRMSYGPDSLNEAAHSAQATHPNHLTTTGGSAGQKRRGISSSDNNVKSNGDKV